MTIHSGEFQTGQFHTGQLHTALLHDFLAAQDAPCPACRYNLRGLRADTCPECGQHLALAIIGQGERRGTHPAYCLCLMGLTLTCLLLTLLLIFLFFASPLFAALFLFLTLGAGTWLNTHIRTYDAFAALPTADRQNRLVAAWAAPALVCAGILYLFLSLL